MSESKTVIIFTQAGCPACHQVKSFLKARGVTYVERDVQTDEAAMAELRARGYAATPLTLVGDVEVLGMNRQKLEAALGASPMELRS